MPIPASNEVAAKAIDEVSQQLCGDDHDRHIPSPTASSEPADSGNRPRHTQKQEETGRLFGAEVSKLSVGCADSASMPRSRIVPGQTQSGTGKRCHSRAEEQKMPNGSDARSPVPACNSFLTTASLVTHSLNINLICQLSLLSAHPNQTCQIMNATEHNLLIDGRNKKRRTWRLTRMQTPAKPQCRRHPNWALWRLFVSTGLNT